jgi:hypothetical protein
MSTKLKKIKSTGVRYTDAKKAQVVSFVEKYNAKNGRGGQSAAVEKYKITPLTIAAWLRVAGVKTPVRKVAKVVKVTKKPKSGSKRGIRYSIDKKKQVVDFVVAYNAKKGRGGQNQAAKKFKISVLTVAAWLRDAGVKKTAVKAAAKKVAKKVSKKVTKKVAKKAAKGLKKSK